MEITVRINTVTITTNIIWIGNLVYKADAVCQIMLDYYRFHVNNIVQQQDTSY